MEEPMKSKIPFIKILERMHEDSKAAEAPMRLYAPEPSDPLHDPRDREWPPRKIEEDGPAERGIAIIDFTV